MAEIWDPTGDTEKGARETVPKTQRDRTTGMAQDLVADEAVILVEDKTEITVEAEVREGGMVTTPTPPPGRTENLGRQSEQLGWR